jgi:nucleotide-binding universal stress UspA family protein
MKYLVAVDGSDVARWAFFTALYLARDDGDELYVCHVVSDVMANLTGDMTGDALKAAQTEVKTAGTRFVQKFLRMGIAEGLKGRIHGVVGVSSHSGEMVCQTASAKGIDVVVIGRRGLGTVKRMIMGSTSKYCVEHCDCDVLVVKGQITRSEEHADKQKVLDEEEAERVRRMAEPRHGCPPASFIAMKAAQAEGNAEPALTESDTDLPPVIQLELSETAEGLPWGVAAKED